MRTQRRTRGRPCGLNAECQKRLLSAIERGLSFKTASALAGISYDTFNRWRRRGEEEDAPPEFRHFCNAISRSQAIGADKLVRAIADIGHKGDWRALAWILERRHPEDWGRAQRHEHSGPDGAPIAISNTHSEMSDEDLNDLVKTIMKNKGNE